jgi:bifunctional UDP-N-acetylglucosamine pyrophosphorylase/glucosamine-1-phosphate N-acetyltransferase
MAVLAFEPEERAQYGLLEMEEGDRVRRVVEWKYWRDFPPEKLSALRFCNAGVYAAKRSVLLRTMALLAERPHRVEKRLGGELVSFDEYFITDLVELMAGGGMRVGATVAGLEEVSGVDDPEALRNTQLRYARRSVGA